MDQKIILMQGIPASGKSTWAKEFCKINPEYVRLNKDTLREQLGGSDWSRKFEDNVFAVELLMAKTVIENGGSLIIDDTNLSSSVRDAWSRFAFNHNLELSFKVMDTPLEVCLERDKAREKSVGKVVIYTMNKRMRELLEDKVKEI